MLSAREENDIRASVYNDNPLLVRSARNGWLHLETEDEKESFIVPVSRVRYATRVLLASRELTVEEVKSDGPLGWSGPAAEKAYAVYKAACESAGRDLGRSEAYSWALQNMREGLISKSTGEPKSEASFWASVRTALNNVRSYEERLQLAIENERRRAEGGTSERTLILVDSNGEKPQAFLVVGSPRDLLNLLEKNAKGVPPQ